VNLLQDISWNELQRVLLAARPGFAQAGQPRRLSLHVFFATRSGTNLPLAAYL
jgi:hypothetical protein